MDRNTLSVEDQKALTGALSAPMAVLTKDQKAIIRARRAYLTPTEQKTYAEVLTDTQEEDQKQVDYTKLKKAELIALCEESDIETDDKMKKEELVKLLTEADTQEEGEE